MKCNEMEITGIIDYLGCISVNNVWFIIGKKCIVHIPVILVFTHAKHI